VEERALKVLVLGDLPDEVEKTLWADDCGRELECLLGARFYGLVHGKVGGFEGSYRNVEIVRHTDEGLSTEAIVRLLDAVRPHGMVVTVVVDVRDVEIVLAAKGIGLEAFGTNSVGYNHFVISDLTGAGLPLFFTPDVLSAAVAQHAVSMMLCLVNNIVLADNYVRCGTWTSEGDSAAQRRLQVEDFFKLTVGIFGMGRIGNEVLRLLAPYGPKVLWHDVRQEVVGRKQEIADAYQGLTKLYGHSSSVSYTTFEDLLGRSDVLTIHADLNSSTRGVFNDAAFSAMRKGAILINAARGAIVDYEALFRRLEDGSLRGAGLDVFPEEPIPDHTRERLSRLPNVLATPHVADDRRTTRNASWSLVLYALVNFLSGRSRPTNVVNADVFSAVRRRPGA